MSSTILRRILANARLYSTGPPPVARSPYRHLRTLALGGSVAITGYTLGSVYPHPYITFISPRPAPAPPDPETPQSIAYTAALEQSLQTLPLLTSLRAQPDAHEWYETRPYVNYAEQLRVNSLTAGALRGPGKLALPPLVRAKRDESEAVVIVHVGRGVCGHDGIIHGGLLATILDESLARTAIINLPDKIGVTANLSINYRAPTFADQFIVVRISLVDKAGRKSKVFGKVEDLKGNLLVEAHATFVQPKYAHLLKSKAVQQMMGDPEPTKSTPVLLSEGMPPPPPKA
ncbi:HotDog domain-containing protein [Suillus clintonianus]|uniref:HotDog domain-containing protein n=1 Tax=Suillus clintonianus TaxID=1904413 RepID=UPI001B86AD83|nr:HotDog domain-containing protein [Suillus clintonianus]KAG2142468.1 HotDog domain-containing protein [Suillus clintonianus]